MSNKFLSFILAVGLLAFWSCMQDHPNDSDVKKEVKINASINRIFKSDEVATRATDETWESGDAIGVFMKNSGADLSEFALYTNAKYVASGTTSFNPATEDDKIFFPFNKSKVDFISYYPYKSDLNELMYEVDVSNQSNLGDIDLLYSNNVKSVNSDEQGIALIFDHQLTKVVLDISSNKTDKNLEGLQAKITNVKTKASFSLIDGKLTDYQELDDISFNVSEDGSKMEAIVLPIEKFTDQVLIITLDNTNYSYSLSKSTEITSFKKSMKCNYSITIEPGEGPILEGVNASITNWETVTEDIVLKEESSSIPPEEGDNPPVVPEGDGSKENPYSITQALQKTKKETEVWVKGYIVGGYFGYNKESFVNNAIDGRKQSLALAFSPNETEFENTFPIALDNDLSTIFNLNNHPNNFKKEICIFGDFQKWSYSSSFVLTLCSIAIMDGVTYK